MEKVRRYKGGECMAVEAGWSQAGFRRSLPEEDERSKGVSPEKIPALRAPGQCHSKSKPEIGRAWPHPRTRRRGGRDAE